MALYKHIAYQNIFKGKDTFIFIPTKLLFKAIPHSHGKEENISH